MRKLIGLALTLGMAVGLASSAFAVFTTRGTQSFTGQAIITDVGTVAMNVSLNSGTQLTWASAGIVLGTTKWKTADNWLVVHSTVSQATAGIQIYTDNRTNAVQVSTMAAIPGGLVNNTSPNQTIPLCWRIVDVATTTLAISQGVPGFPDRLYTAQITNGDQYPCFIWMKDKATASIAQGGTLPWAGQVGGMVMGEPYCTFKDSVNGVMHAEMTYARMPSPDIIYVGADFTNAAGGTTYSGKIVVEAFIE